LRHTPLKRACLPIPPLRFLVQGSELGIEAFNFEP
jgi:hypothetical protein